MLPRILVISNDPFSQSDSNGRTLGNFFLDYPKGELAQIYLNSAPLDLIDCAYFQISDRNLLDHFKKFAKVGVERHYQSPIKATMESERPHVKKNPLTCLLRDDLWRTRVWSTKRLWSWIRSFNPDIVLLQASDMPYLFSLALEVTKKSKARLVIYNSEDYYFKDWNYLMDENGHKRLYPRFHRRLVRATKKAINSASLCIYNCEYVEQDYQKLFPDSRSSFVYTATTWKPTPFVPHKDHFQVTYFGNFTDGRAKSLITMAETLATLKPHFDFDVYGTIYHDEDRKLLESCPLLHYHKPVPYEQVRHLAEISDLIVHAESFVPFIVKDRKSVFSTKMADCMASGRPFLVYAPSSMAMTRYLLDRKLDYVATNDQELKEKLETILKDGPEVQEAIKRMALAAEANHDSKTNCAKFQALLMSVMEEKD
jgi:glycosyltransferase involved in cell wall biosynthesis